MSKIRCFQGNEQTFRGFNHLSFIYKKSADLAKALDTKGIKTIKTTEELNRSRSKLQFGRIKVKPSKLKTKECKDKM